MSTIDVSRRVTADRRQLRQALANLSFSFICLLSSVRCLLGPVKALAVTAPAWRRNALRRARSAHHPVGHFACTNKKPLSLGQGFLCKAPGLITVPDPSLVRPPV